MKPQPARSGDRTTATAATRSVPEAAVVLGISTWLAWKLVWSGEIPSIRLGNRVLVPNAAIEEILASADKGGADKKPAA